MTETAIAVALTAEVHPVLAAAILAPMIYAALAMILKACRRTD